MPRASDLAQTATFNQIHVSLRSSTARGGTTKFLIIKPKLCCRFSFIHRIIPEFEELRKTRTIPLSYNPFKNVLNSCLDP
ncbi:hypothetical protein Y032_0008g59 [Ancylostoma ceylanicum]|uniref:Uncharacterized protein n=1 Tax=Ancylostoma ceylanicum TaxID=53326 RepID=A0A016VKU9_9BILA|nr:hypothetical protein Y032_0008g59 [Ancylostoma ceylanicum]